jgi:quinol monooxygenase YgiN
MSIIAILEFRLNNDVLDAANAKVKEILADTRAFPGCEGLDVLVDRDDPAHVFIYEKWESNEADAAYRAWRAGDGAADFTGLLAAVPVLNVFKTDYSL